MASRAILASIIVICSNASAGDELTFDRHGFSLTLADEWAIREASPLYEKYLSTNEKALGEGAARVLSENTQVIFKANRAELHDTAAVYTCIVARNIEAFEEMTDAQRNELIEGAALSSYRLLASRGLGVTEPMLEEKNGIAYATYRLTQREGKHTTEYKVFVSEGGMVVCAGGVMSEYLDDVVLMNDSIKRLAAGM